MYISDEHERALKARARELGVSEAELLRRMLDGLLLDEEGYAGCLAFPVLPRTGPVVLEALRGVWEHLLSYYDGPDLDRRPLGAVSVVLSEDFNPGPCLMAWRSLTRSAQHSSWPR